MTSETSHPGAPHSRDASSPQKAGPTKAPDASAGQALPEPLVHIWESYVRSQAAQGRTEVHAMVPTMIAMLAERGVANLRPDEARRRRIERWRDALQGELVRISQAEAQNAASGHAADALQDGFRAIDVAKSIPTTPDGADTGNELTYSFVLLFKRSELEAHKRQVDAMVGPAIAALKELHLQQETMLQHRLELMQRLSASSAEMLQIGQEVMRKYQAGKSKPKSASEPVDVDMDVALASLLPPRVQVTYGTVFNTFWQKVERLLQR